MDGFAKIIKKLRENIYKAKTIVLNSNKEKTNVYGEITVHIGAVYTPKCLNFLYIYGVYIDELNERNNIIVTYCIKH